MQVRIPRFDTSRFRADWAPHREFAQNSNANSIVPAHIEPYLVKVIARARKELDPSETQLLEDTDIFIRQETQHCQQHVAFNRLMYAAGYEGMKEIEKGYRAEYARFLAQKSLKFNLAYCEGFEALGCASADNWFDGTYDEMLRGADPYAMEMWRWHLAEEFEHRTVCFDVYMALYGRGWWNAIVNGYFYRIYMLVYAIRHIREYTARCYEYLLEQDRKGMSAEQLEQSLARVKAMKKVIGKATLPRLLKVLSPFYNPRHKRMPDNMKDLLARYAGPAA